MCSGEVWDSTVLMFLPIPHLHTGLCPTSEEKWEEMEPSNQKRKALWFHILGRDGGISLWSLNLRRDLTQIARKSSPLFPIRRKQQEAHWSHSLRELPGKKVFHDHVADRGKKLPGREQHLLWAPWEEGTFLHGSVLLFIAALENFKSKRRFPEMCFPKFFTRVCY